MTPSIRQYVEGATHFRGCKTSSQQKWTGMQYKLLKEQKNTLTIERSNT